MRWRAVQGAFNLLLFLFVALPSFGLAYLGFAGKLTDTSAGENRGQGVMMLAAGLLVVSINVIWLYATLAGRRQRPAVAGGVPPRIFHHCPNCGYELTFLWRPDSCTCPECGAHLRREDMPAHYSRKIRRQDLRLALWIALPLLALYAFWALTAWGIVRFR